MITINANDKQYLPLGRLGENEITIIQFDVSKFLPIIEDGNFSLINQRPTENFAYPCTIVLEDNILSWQIKQSDLKYEGRGKCELILMRGDQIAKSCIFQTVVGGALDGSGDPPEPYEDWIAEVLQAKVDAEAAAEKAETAVEHYPYIDSKTKHWFVWDAEAGEYIDTGISAQGGAGNWEELEDKPFESLNTHDLSVQNGELRVNTTNEADPDNTLPITSAGTYVIVGNIETILGSI